MAWIRGADGNWLWDPESQGDLTLLDKRKMARPEEFTAEINRQEAANNAATFPDPANNVEDLRKEQKSLRNAKQQPAQQPISAEEAAFRRLKAGHGTDADVAMFKDWTAEQLKARGFGPKSIAYFASLHGGLNDQIAKPVGKAITTGLSNVFSAFNGKKQEPKFEKPTPFTRNPASDPMSTLTEMKKNGKEKGSLERGIESTLNNATSQRKAFEDAAFKRLKIGQGTEADAALFKNWSPEQLAARGFGPKSIEYFKSLRKPLATFPGGITAADLKDENSLLVNRKGSLETSVENTLRNANRKNK